MPELVFASLVDSVRVGLQARQKWLPPKYLYDPVGSALFEAISLLPEYYLTRTERAILKAHAHDIVARVAPGARLVELGAGSASKTRLLIAAMQERGGIRDYCPIDISLEALRAAEANVRSEFPNVAFRGILDDWLVALGDLRRMGREEKLILFLGSNIGNLDPAEAARFLKQVRATMAPGDKLLVGTDMVKDEETLLAAYDDAAGVTAAFNRNLLVRLNRELAADFDVRAFRHEARWDPHRRRVEMHLVAMNAQEVMLRGAGLVVQIARGESIHTENSHKFTAADIMSMAEAGGLRVTATWRDESDAFRLSLMEVA
jgi:L-histidine Nalpha-methyltransferase